MSSTSTELSVIIPTYNESKNIPILIERLGEALEKLPHEIIVVDDNSPDRTWEVAEKISETNPRVKAIRRVTDKGLSSAVLTGMAMAEGKVFAVVDGDLQHDEKILPEMYRVITEDGFEVSVGSRGAEGGSYGDWSKRRRFVSWVAATMAKVLLPMDVSDPMSGFFAISRECYQKNVEFINPRGFKILLEFLGRGGRKKTKEVGYTFSNRLHGETKMSASVIRNYIIALVDIRFGKYVSPTFLLYAAVGATGVLVQIVGYNIGDWISLPKITTGISKNVDPLHTAAIFGYQLAVLSNYILNNYITFYENRYKGFWNLKGLIVFELVSLYGLVVFLGAFQLMQVNGFLEGKLDDFWRTQFNVGIASIIAMVANYYLNLNITWGKRR